jgi:hypothetical protein
MSGSGAPVIVVTGLPRSGTSMLMRMLKAGGVPIVTDGRRAPDHMNRYGYFEDDGVRQLAQDARCLDSARGRAVKIVIPLLEFLPDHLEYRLIVLDRDSSDVARSQAAMSRDLGVEPPANLEALVGEMKLRAECVLARWSGADLLRLRYAAVLADPAAAAAQIATFLEQPLDRAGMTLAVDRSLASRRP